MMNQQQALVIELNEFNLDLLKHASTALNLKNIKRILSFNQGITLADQLTEHQGLDPWVQWVSVHAESPSQKHGIIRLGDISKLNHNQIWERLSSLGIKTGVWGVMNAARKNSPSNQFFVADPWTFTEVAYPQELNSFLALPVYFAKNYLDLSPLKMLWNGMKTGWYALRNIRLSLLLSDALFLFKGLLSTKKLGTSFLFCAYELIATRVFFKYRKKYNPQVNFIFLNSIAHFQHHDWQGLNKLDETSKFVFRCIDRMLSIILPPEESSTKVLVLNGLSQRNVSEENHYCYRQINPKRFLLTLGLNPSRIEQCMTNDAHVFFESEADRNQSASLISSITINGGQAFFVEKDPDTPLKLFYQVAISDKLDDAALLKFQNKEIPFFSEFAVYAKRTGAHIPTGAYLVDGFTLPESMNNSDIFSYVWPRESLL